MVLVQLEFTIFFNYFIVKQLVDCILMHKGGTFISYCLSVSCSKVLITTRVYYLNFLKLSSYQFGGPCTLQPLLYPRSVIYVSI